MTRLFIEAKKITILSLPIIGVQIVGAINGFIAVLMIAMLGHKELAAGALVSSISTMLNLIGWSTLFSIAVIIGRHLGENKIEEIGNIVRQGWLLGIFIAIPLMIIFWNMELILHFFGQQKQLIDLAGPYFRILTWAVLPGMWYICFLQFVIGISKLRIFLYINIFGIVLMLILGYCLLFGRLGLPKLGMVGMAYANVFASWTFCLIYTSYLYFHPYYKQFYIFRYTTNKKKINYLKQLFDIGYPISIQAIGELTAYTFALLMIGWLGEAALVAQQITLQLGYLICMVPYAISETSSVLISQTLGKRGYQKFARTYGNTSVFLGFVFTAIVAVVYFVFPKLLISLFSIDVNNSTYEVTVHTATLLLAVAGITQIVDGIRRITIGALKGFHDTKIPMIFGLISSWGINIPVGFLMTFWLHWGAVGVHIGFLIGCIFGTIILMKRFYKKTKL